MPHSRELNLGLTRALDGADPKSARLPAHHLVTHGVVVGMTGSGKTGLLTVMVEEALQAGIPSLIIDVKGDLPNLLLAFDSFDAEHFVPWANACAAATDQRPPEVIAQELADKRRAGLDEWSIDEQRLVQFSQKAHVRVLTPGSTAGEPLHVLSALERHDDCWERDPEAARASLSAAISLVLRLVGRDPDPARSAEHVLLSVLAERRLRAGRDADLTALLDDLQEPPIDRVGALSIDAFFSKRKRADLAAGLNTLLASPTFASWREGAPLDVDSWLTPKDERTPAVIVSVAHLDDDERQLVLGVLLEEVLSWVRSLSGSQRLRALVVFDEIYGFLPPHPKSPPTKAPLVALLKQARAFGVGLLLATQNPMDLDYRALSNAGLWCIGRLQTDADRARIVDGLALGPAVSGMPDLRTLLPRLTPRWFVMRDAHSREGARLLHPRFAMSFLRGPMTRTEIRRARGEGELSDAEMRGASGEG